MFPAKFGFDTNATPNCTNYVVFGLNVAGITGGQANIVGLNQLYSGTAPRLCNQSNPSVYFAYNGSTASGSVFTSPSLTLDGKKIVYIESAANASVFHILTWKSGDGASRRDAVHSVSPTRPPSCSPTSSCLISVQYAASATTLASPWIDYATDKAFVAADDGTIARISCVFACALNATPTVDWTYKLPVAGTGGPNPVPSGPVYKYPNGLLLVTKGAQINHGEDWCISFGGLRVDEAMAQQVLQMVSGNAVEAALEAAEQLQQQRNQQRKTIELEVAQAQYEARLAARRYEAVDPENRLVAAELEARWNAALVKARELEQKLQEFHAGIGVPAIPDRSVLLSLAQDLPAVWNAATADMRLKQRIMRILIQEIVADVDEATSEVVLLIHWVGGRHSELRVKKNHLGQHRRCTSLEAIEVICQMAGKHTDEQIATTLNTLGLRTGVGHTWTEQRVYSARRYHLLPAFDPQRAKHFVTLEQAAQRLGVSPTTVRRLIRHKKLDGTQVLPCAP